MDAKTRLQILIVFAISLAVRQTLAAFINENDDPMNENNMLSSGKAQEFPDTGTTRSSAAIKRDQHFIENYHEQIVAISEKLSESNESDQESVLVGTELSNQHQQQLLILDKDLKLPSYMRILATLACLIIFVIGVTGNLLVPLVVIKTKYLRNSTNLFLINLSVADLLVLIVCMPTVLIELHSRPETWLLGESMCKLTNFIEMLAANGSIFTILAISFERYYAICKPLKAGYKCTRLRAMVIICIIWLLSSILTSPILMMAKSSETPYIDGSMVQNCILETDSYWPKMYVFVSMFAFFCLPLLVLMLVYWLIGRRLIRENLAMSSASATRPSLGGYTESGGSHTIGIGSIGGAKILSHRLLRANRFAGSVRKAASLRSISSFFVGSFNHDTTIQVNDGDHNDGLHHCSQRNVRTRFPRENTHGPRGLTNTSASTKTTTTFTTTSSTSATDSFRRRNFSTTKTLSLDPHLISTQPPSNSLSLEASKGETDLSSKLDRYVSKQVNGNLMTANGDQEAGKVNGGVNLDQHFTFPDHEIDGNISDHRDVSPRSIWYRFYFFIFHSNGFLKGALKAADAVEGSSRKAPNTVISATDQNDLDQSVGTNESFLSEAKSRPSARSDEFDSAAPGRDSISSTGNRNISQRCSQMTRTPEPSNNSSNNNSNNNNLQCVDGSQIPLLSSSTSSHHPKSSMTNVTSSTRLRLDETKKGESKRPAFSHKAFKAEPDSIDEDSDEYYDPGGVTSNLKGVNTKVGIKAPDWIFAQRLTQRFSNPMRRQLSISSSAGSTSIASMQTNCTILMVNNGENGTDPIEEADSPAVRSNARSIDSQRGADQALDSSDPVQARKIPPFESNPLANETSNGFVTKGEAKSILTASELAQSGSPTSPMPSSNLPDSMIHDDVQLAKANSEQPKGQANDTSNHKTETPEVDESTQINTDCDINQATSNFAKTNPHEGISDISELEKGNQLKDSGGSLVLSKLFQDSCQRSGQALVTSHGAEGRSKSYSYHRIQLKHDRKPRRNLSQTSPTSFEHQSRQRLSECSVSRDLTVKKQQMDSRRQVVIMLAFVVACFFLLFFPYRVFTIWLILSTEDQVQSLGMETYYNLTYFSRILIYLHSAINPIAYNLISIKFRSAFMSILFCRGSATRRHFITDHKLTSSR